MSISAEVRLSSARAASMLMRMSVSIDLTSGCWMIGAPNCTRCAAYSCAAWYAASAMPIACAATPSRALFIRSSMARKPCPRVASRNASARSNSMTHVGEPWMPSFDSTRATRSPFGRPSGSVFGHSIRLSPLVVPFDCSKVSASRASTRWTCAPPFVMKIFSPSMK